MSLEGGDILTFGEARAVSPMGGLAKLVWLRVEGSGWSTGSAKFRCQGAAGSLTCGTPSGHGTVSLAKALEEDCDLAFLAWIAEVRARWLKDYGPEVAWYRVVEVFEPFLGRRLPANASCCAPAPRASCAGCCSRRTPRWRPSGGACWRAIGPK